MTDQPPIPIPMKFSEGDRGPGIRCKECRIPMPIAQDLATVPDKFQARCPKCGHSDVYQKSEIRTFVARRKQ